MSIGMSVMASMEHAKRYYFNISIAGIALKVAEIN